MTRGVPQLSITVVPDSGTGQLTGSTGKFLVIIRTANTLTSSTIRFLKQATSPCSHLQKKAFSESKPWACDFFLKLTIIVVRPAPDDTTHASNAEIARGLSVHS
jgi:hypothetical protein